MRLIDVWPLAVLVLALTSFEPAASAQTLDGTSPRVSEVDPCAMSELPAISPSGRRVAYVSCSTDLSDALDARFVVMDTRDGSTLSTILLAMRPTGGEGGTPAESIRRRVARVNRALATGGFRAMVEVDGRVDPGSEGHAAGLVVTFDGERERLEARDADGATRGALSLSETPMNPYCCGREVDDTTPCSLPPEVRRAWVDAGGRLVLAEIIGGSHAPDGCEAGPDFVLLRADAS